ncbi:L-lactate dehydrogenase [Desulfotomaculum nigrificans CO-1-SRB]|uniref:L-lactate dehydrogenase n=1 Tax=Desulfotomaculum nigrificans (strain DSM 14880 / VKM B-2319 / CO-1-SRB) TaxID=868595 RepID=F6B7Q3_DESCC|nr:L-lactate dehydrogenase [Desulfotomaculum nigrificans]AEF93425.1 L-lactate dehydrogenase [Desulfotomaculum nigrificans CO-1-SRB]
MVEKKKGVKIAIVGVGLVGASAAFAIMISGMASQLVLVDVNKDKAEGEAMDLGDAAAFIKPINVMYGTYADCQGADIVVFTAGANQKPGETRLDLVQKNIAILKESLPQLLKYCSESIILMVSNPVDVLTYAALKISGLPASQVFGSGTVLDTSRFKAELAEYCQVDPRNVHAYIVGEHGDSEVALWSTATVAGIDIEQYCQQRGLAPIDRQLVAERVRTAAYEIIKRKGATYYAVALSIKRICEAILRNENSILTVSGLVNNLYGIEHCCLSLPTIVNGTGRSKVIALPMTVREEEALRNSAQVLKEIIKQVGF